MRIKCAALFQERILPARMVKTPSFFARDEFDDVLEADVDGTPFQIQSPGFGLVIVEAGPDELAALETSGYHFTIGN
jgi:hypothetical protein